MSATPSFCQELTVLSCTGTQDSSLVNLVLENPGWICRPGQFVMLRPLDWGTELVWARPFSICDISSHGLRIFFQVVGRGTARLAQLTPGQKVVVWGPLGQSFVLDNERPNLLLAGGMGIAPFVFLAKSSPAHTSMLFGHRLPLQEYPAFQEIATHIPSEAMQQCNHEDLICFEETLHERIKALSGVGQVLACGPEPMLRVVHKYCLQHGTDGQVSLENRMACGVGACLGCVARTTQGDLVQSCVQGPVFDVRHLDWGA